MGQRGGLFLLIVSVAWHAICGKLRGLIVRLCAVQGPHVFGGLAMK